MANYLDETGLARVWGKVKGLFTKSNVETALGHTIDKNVPSNAVFTDSNVTQTATDGSSNAEYEILFSRTADNTTRTEGTRKTSLFTFNPQTNQATAGHFTAKSSSPSGNQTASLVGYDVQLGGTSNTWDGTNTSLKTTISGIKSSLSDYLPKNVSGVGNLRILGKKDIYPQFTNGDAQLVTTNYVPLADLDKIIAVIPFGVGARLICALTGNRGQIALTTYGSSYTGNAINVTMLFILAD